MQDVKAKIIIGDSRRMVELEDESIDLVITSPPYWHIKDYGVEGQIGYGQTLHEYLKDLYLVWFECYRVLKAGRRLCINIGDLFARSVVYGRYKVIPLHAEVVLQCEKIGFDYMGSIIWQKKTTMNTTGGANVMGSYPYPPNGMVEIDYEFILIFKKPGKAPKVLREVKEKSKLTKEEWKEYFKGHWRFGGAKQLGHEAMFPEELPFRLIKMFSFVGDTVLDPFLGSGTTVRAALKLSRNAVGYEINERFVPIIKEKLGVSEGMLSFMNMRNVDFVFRKEEVKIEEPNYSPVVKDAQPIKDPSSCVKRELYKVTEVINEKTLLLEDGRKVEFLGVEIVKKREALDYLRKRVLGKKIYIRFDKLFSSKAGDVTPVYIYLKNGIFVNAYLIKSGLAIPDQLTEYAMKQKFLKMANDRGVVVSG